MAHSGHAFTRIALGIVFLWFGVLKFMPNVTAVDQLAENTLVLITLHLFRPENCLHVLAFFECMIGLGLLFNRFTGPTIILLSLQMPGTFLPLILFPQQTWIHFPWFPSFVGQYIIKNFVLIAAIIIVGSAARGGRIIANPDIAMRAERVEEKVEARALHQAEDTIAKAKVTGETHS